MQSEGDGDASFAGYTSTALSTREPLCPGSPHPLLAPLNSLLAVLLIPLTLTSLSLATPSLLLNVLEALLETRLEDVPAELRASWERSKRIRVAEVLVEAVAEVLDGLARAKGVTGKAHWRRGDVEINQVVRGVESELAKLVEGLLQIAEGMGVVSHGDEEPTLSLAEEQHDDPFDSIAVPNSSSSTLPPRFPRFPLFTSTTPFNPSSTPTRSILFAPRPLRQSHSHSPPATAPLRATFSQLPPRPPPRASSSASSSSSVQTATSRSTSLTIPSRPSLVSELSKSGSLSPPPQSPRTSSGRSTLRLMQRRLEEQEWTPIAPLSFHVEVQQAASCRPQERPEVPAPDSGDLEEDAESFFEPLRSTPVVPIRSTRDSQPIVAAAKISKKGKERAVVDAASETPGSHECVCYDGCGATLRLSAATSSSASDVEGDETSASSSMSLPAARRRHRGRRGAGEEPGWCGCGTSGGEEGDASDTTEAGNNDEGDEPTRSKDLGRRPRQPWKSTRHHHRSHSSHTINPSASSHSILPAAAPPPSSPPARRVRIVRTAALATEEAGDLSVHGDSEIEAFEAARRGTARPLSPAPPATPAAPEPTRLASVVTTATPSPYTMLLLAQRARLAEKLKALQLRERDRREAEGRLAAAA
ncbi:hypothetical protein JCM5296_005005 [Sporobolomyces johnsonii]